MAIPSQAIHGALNAYASAAKSKGPGLEPRDSTAGEEFANLVKNATQAVIDNNKASEAAAMGAVSDKQDMAQVVTAVAEAQLSLETAVTIRDKVIEAYREILRMPI